MNIKPLDSMTSMYTDMAAGAAVLGAMRIVADRRLPIRVTGLLPAAENSVSGIAMRQGDVVRHYGGRTSEVNNTDAEGRLVLADAMAYAVDRLKPTVLIDLATLTGAMKVALGTGSAACSPPTDALAAGLSRPAPRSASRCGGCPWPTTTPRCCTPRSPTRPTPPATRAVSPPRCSCALRGGVPWAHLDIAGPARSPDDRASSAGAQPVSAPGCWANGWPPGRLIGSFRSYRGSP